MRINDCTCCWLHRPVAQTNLSNQPFAFGQVVRVSQQVVQRYTALYRILPPFLYNIVCYPVCFSQTEGKGVGKGKQMHFSGHGMGHLLGGSDLSGMQPLTWSPLTPADPCCLSPEVAGEHLKQASCQPDVPLDSMSSAGCCEGAQTFVLCLFGGVSGVGVPGIWQSCCVPNWR